LASGYCLQPTSCLRRHIVCTAKAEVSWSTDAGPTGLCG
jgi:hypothetical protein